MLHLLDTSAVAEVFYEYALSPATRKFIKSFFLNADGNAIKKLLVFSAGIHDLGKVSPHFQLRQQVLKEQQIHWGYLFPDPKLEVTKQPHNFISQRWVRDTIKNNDFPFIDNKLTDILTKAIGGHHGTFATTGDLRDALNGYGRGTHWEVARVSIYNILKANTGLINIDQTIVHNPTIPHLPFQYWLTGFVTLCDWLASMDIYFPYEQHINTGFNHDYAAYYSRSLLRAKTALDNIGFKYEKVPHVPEFGELFNKFLPHTQQIEFSSAVKVARPRLIIVEAPMGIGKTEMSFWASEYLNHEDEKPGTYIAMPTQAVSNQMYLRYKDFLSSRNDNSPKALPKLLHSSSQLFLRNQSISGSPTAIGEDTISDQQTLSTQDWFKPKKRGLLSPYAVGTIDQILISVIRTKHNYLRLFGLQGKTIIIDEVHSYDLYMSSLLKRFLEWAYHMDISVIILSATLPRAKKTELLQSCTKGPAVLNMPYPRLTFALNETAVEYQLTKPNPVSISVNSVFTDNVKEIIDFIIQKSDCSGCIAVIANRVDFVQKLFMEFTARETGIECILLHSRFPAWQRAVIEKRIISSLGRSSQRPESLIVFSTQILEQSLDLDFDIMFTELAPVDLLLQRAGRLHRFKDTPRKNKFQLPQLYWFINPDSIKSNRIYEPLVLYKTYISLRGLQAINIPGDLEMLIESVYGDTQPDCSAEETKTIDELTLLYNRSIKEQEQKANQVLIPEPAEQYPELNQTFQLLDEDDPHLHPDIKAVTRLGAPSLRIICLSEENGCLYFVDGNNTPVNGVAEDLISIEQAAHASSVPISRQPFYKLILSNKNTELPAAWKKISSLRYARILVFNDGHSVIPGVEISLDEKLGIIYNKYRTPLHESL